MLGVVHISPTISVPVVALLALGIAWYYKRVGARSVPPSRRRIRRVSISMMLVLLAVMIRGTSFLDVDLSDDRLAYANTWGLAVLLLVCIAGTAVADFVNNMRLLLEAQAHAVEKAARDVISEIESAQRNKSG